MVTVACSIHFEKTIRKIRNAQLKKRLKAQIVKIVNNPEIGKPMRFSRKQTREVYIPPFRLSYLYDKRSDTLVFLFLYHKDEQ
jgi:mRNA-degrading endonuclease RelE of RelBE toxin-antitoxin system